VVLVVKVVGKVDSFQSEGLQCWFNSDDHLPPHFHAEKPGEWEVRVYFLRAPKEMFETKWSKRKGNPSKATLGSLAKRVEAERANLLVEWESKVNVKAPGLQR
jgi:hypothetical protein